MKKCTAIISTQNAMQGFITEVCEWSPQQYILDFKSFALFFSYKRMETRIFEIVKSVFYIRKQFLAKSKMYFNPCI